jgi:hypothetical protein
MAVELVIVGLIGIIFSLYMDKQGSILAGLSLRASTFTLILGILHPLFN